MGGDIAKRWEAGAVEPTNCLDDQIEFEDQVETRLQRVGRSTQARTAPFAASVKVGSWRVRNTDQAGG